MSATAVPTSDFVAQPPATGEEASATSWPSFVPQDESRKDYFAGQGDEIYAGRHLILDIWETSGLDDLAKMEAVLREAVTASGATLLHIHLHHFMPNDGISGVAVLAESHLSVHTWPERDYAAFDIFMCGGTRPEAAAEVIVQAFNPGRRELRTLVRGRFDANSD